MKFSDENIKIESIEDIANNKKNFNLLLEEIIYRFEKETYPKYDSKEYNSIYVLEERDHENVDRVKLKEFTYNKLKDQLKEDSNIRLLELPEIPVKLYFYGKNFNLFTGKLKYLLPNIDVTTVYDTDSNKADIIYGNSNFKDIYKIDTSFENLKKYFD